MKLYTYAVAPNPRRVGLLMKYKGIEIESQEIDLVAKEQFSPEFSAINPRLTLPALVLADGTMPNSTHSRIHQHLGQRRFGGWRFLPLVRFGHRADEIWRVVIRDVLQGVSNAGNQVFLTNDRHTIFAVSKTAVCAI